jgi:hypothetical protein
VKRIPRVQSDLQLVCWLRHNHSTSHDATNDAAVTNLTARCNWATTSSIVCQQVMGAASVATIAGHRRAIFCVRSHTQVSSGFRHGSVFYYCWLHFYFLSFDNRLLCPVTRNFLVAWGERAETVVVACTVFSLAKTLLFFSASLDAKRLIMLVQTLSCSPHGISSWQTRVPGYFA